LAIRDPGHAMVKIFSLTLFLAVSGALYFPIQAFVERKTAEAKREIVDFLESRIKRKIAYESISPSIFRYVEIRNLSLTDAQGGRLTTIKKLRVHYDVFSLIGRKGGPGISEISVENSSLEFDLRRDRDLIDFLLGRNGSDGATESPEASGGPFIRKVKITGRNLNIVVRTEDGEWTAERLFLVLQPGRDAASVRIRGGLSYEAAKDGALFRWGRTVVDLRGQVGNSYERSEVQIAFSRFASNLFDARRQTFRVVFDGESLAMRKVQDNTPFDAGLVFHLPTRTLKGDFISSNFTPSTVVRFKDSLSYLNDWMGTALTAKVAAGWEPSSGKLAYSADFDSVVKGSVAAGETRIVGKAGGNEREVRFAPFRVVNARTDSVFEGTVDLESLLPEGKVKITRLDLPDLPRMSGEFDLRRSGGALSFSGPGVAIGNETIRAPEGRILVGKSLVRVSAAFSLDEVGASSVRADLSFPFAKNSPMSFGVDFEAVPSSKIVALVEEVSPGHELPLDDLKGRDFALFGSVSGSTDFRSLSLNFPAIVVRDGRNGMNFVELSGSFDRGRIEVSRWNFRWAAVSGNGNLRGELSEDGRLVFESGFSILDVPYEISGLLDPRGYLRLKGLYGLSAELAWKERGPLFGDVAIENLPLPGLGDDVRLSAKAGVNFEDMSSWKVDITTLSLTGLRVVPGTVSAIELAGTLGPLRGDIAKLKYRDRHSELEGGGVLRYEFRPPSISGDLKLSDSGGKERYSLTFSANSTAGSGLVGFAGAPAERLGIAELTGRLAGSAVVTGIPDDPDVRLSATLEDAALGDSSLAVSVSGSYRRGVFTLDEASARYRYFQIAGAKGELDLGRGTFDLETGFSYRLSTSPVEWRLGFKARFDQNSRIEDLRNIPAGKWWGGVTVSTSNESVDPLLRGWSMDVRREGNTTEFSGGPGEGLKGYYRDDGGFELSVQEPLPVTFDASGTLTSTRIEADFNRIAFKAEKIPKLLDLTVLKFLRGQAKGNIRVSGPLRDPDFFGAITATQVYAKVEIIPEELGPFRGNLIFREKEFVLQSMLVPVEGGTAEVSASFTLDQWIPETYAVDIDTKSSGAVHVKYAFGPMNLNGFAKGRLSINGDMQTAKITGNITAFSTVMTIGDINAVSSAAQQSQQQPQTAIVLDLNIESGKAVEFYWPNTNFPILRTYADIGQKLSVRLDSRTTDFRVVGDIKIIGGEIFYFDRSFYLREGMIRFDERKELFDPTLTARAEIRESTDEGLVRIYLVADNTKLSQFFPRFESDSALTNPEILAILGKNIFTTEPTDSINFSTALLVTSDVLSQIGLVRNFERDMRERLDVDLFSFRTHIVQNVLQEAVNRSNTTETTRATDYNDVSFGRYLDKTSVFLGKYLSKDIFLELLMQFYARDPLERRRREFGGMEIESEIMLEWKTPFFLLEWTLAPSNPDELFVRDMTFAFKWKFSF